MTRTTSATGASSKLKVMGSPVNAGTGLGVAITRSLPRMMRGSLPLASLLEASALPVAGIAGPTAGAADGATAGTASAAGAGAAGAADGTGAGASDTGAAGTLTGSPVLVEPGSAEEADWTAANCETDKATAVRTYRYRVMETTEQARLTGVGLTRGTEHRAQRRSLGSDSRCGCRRVGGWRCPAGRSRWYRSSRSGR